MDLNTSFTYPSWDKVYVKILRKIVECPNCRWRDISISLYGKDCGGRNRTVLDGLIAGHAVYISGYGKNRACLYAATPAGKEIYAEALSTKPLCEVLEFAKKFNTYEEFELNCTLAGMLHVCEEKFFNEVLSNMIFSNTTVMKHMKRKFMREVKFFNEWQQHMCKFDPKIQQFLAAK